MHIVCLVAKQFFLTYFKGVMNWEIKIPLTFWHIRGAMKKYSVSRDGRYIERDCAHLISKAGFVISSGKSPSTVFKWSGI